MAFILSGVDLLFSLSRQAWLHDGQNEQNKAGLAKWAERAA